MRPLSATRKRISHVNCAATFTLANICEIPISSPSSLIVVISCISPSYKLIIDVLLAMDFVFVLQPGGNSFRPRVSTFGLVAAMVTRYHPRKSQARARIHYYWSALRSIRDRMHFRTCAFIHIKLSGIWAALE